MNIAILTPVEYAKAPLSRPRPAKAVALTASVLQSRSPDILAGTGADLKGRLRLQLPPPTDEKQKSHDSNFYEKCLIKSTF